MTQLHPFADDTASLGIGGLTVENGTDRLAIYGSLDIFRSQEGLAHARTLLAVLSDAVKALEAEHDLPAKLATLSVLRTRPNPFGWQTVMILA